MSLFALLSPFYVASGPEVGPGDIGKAIVPAPSPKPWVLVAGRSDPRSHDSVQGEIRGMDRDDFKRSEVLPVFALGQRRDEALRVERVRRTLAVVLSTSTTAGDIGSPAVTASAVVAPLAPFEIEGRPSEFSPAVRARIEALMHAFLFPCPQNDKPFVAASAIRLDRPQVVIPSAVTWEPLGIRLSDEVRSLLLATCRRILGSSGETELDEVRSILADAVPPEYLPG
jgi:hypothetical protein